MRGDSKLPIGLFDLEVTGIRLDAKQIVVFRLDHHGCDLWAVARLAEDMYQIRVRNFRGERGLLSDSKTFRDVD